MRIVISSPTRAYLENYTDLELETLSKQLTYTNTATQHKLKRHIANHWARNKNKEAWTDEYERLKGSVKNTLVYSDLGRKFIRPGSVSYLEGFKFEIVNEINYPTPKKVAWNKPLPFQLHDYQEISAERLVEEKHSSVELCTGAGKSAILLKVCRETGFRTAIIAPSRSIFNELLEKFEHHLGKANVGAFGDGKKRIGKKFTICIGDSLSNVKPGTKEWEFFSTLDMLCVDESHTWGAETLEDLCHGIFADLPYRLFFSGTQTRGDGAEKLLQSIIGKTVHTLTTKEAKEKGYICDHDFKIVSIESSNPNYAVADPLEMKRVHFLNNRNIAAFIAKLVNAEAMTYRRQSLILVEELSQLAMILPLLKVPTVIAHSESKKERLAELGLTKVDPAESVDKFNRGEAMALAGTSCIATGTNIFPTHNTFNWVGGASEIKTKQGTVGRSVRKHENNPYKDKCLVKEKASIWDFNVYDIEVMVKQLEDRISYYKDSGSDIKYIRLK